MRRILLNPLLGHLTDGGTEVPACPEVSPPVALLQHRELLEPFAGGTPFDPAHDLTRCHGGRCRDEDVHMILAHDPLQNLDLEDLACLPDQLSHAQRHITCEDLVAVLGDPDKVVLDVLNRVTAISILHSSSTVKECGGLLYLARNSGDEICPPKGGGLNLVNGK